MFDTERQTGRTTEQLRQLVGVAAGGGTTFYYVHTHALARYVASILRDRFGATIAKERGLWVARYGEGSIAIKPVERREDLFAHARGRKPTDALIDHECAVRLGVSSLEELCGRAG